LCLSWGVEALYVPNLTEIISGFLSQLKNLSFL
jgi:hypothetical protein